MKKTNRPQYPADELDKRVRLTQRILEMDAYNLAIVDAFASGLDAARTITR